MTEKIYETDSYAKECNALVRACTAVEGGFDLLLDRTVFFPEAGGQPCDLGTIGVARVRHVREEGDEVVHRCDKALIPGEEAALQIDWARRFDYMQQHTGEHLLSFAMHKLFAANNIGFHLAETDYTTIDFDQPLSPEQLGEAQRLTNALIWRNLGIRVQFYDSAEALAGLPLRKQAEGLCPPIRVVSMEDADMCTCCAPHCRQSGEVGMLLITDAMAYKGGTRVFFVCGGRALGYAANTHDAMDALARRFSCQRAMVPAAVEKLSADYARARHNEKALGAALNDYVIAELKAGAETLGKKRLILKLLENVEAGRLKSLAQGTLGGETLCILLSKTEAGLAYVVAASDGFLPDAGELIQVVNAATGGKGGGRNGFAQGMAPSAGGAAETLAQLGAYLRQRLS